MSNEYLNLLQDEDEDVVLEGSDLYHILIDMGYTNFELMPKVKTEFNSLEAELAITKDYFSLKQYIYDKKNLICRYILQENKLKSEQLRIILEANVLLDDHATIINELFHEEKNFEQHRTYLKLLPFIGSGITAVSGILYQLLIKKKNIFILIASSTVIGILAYAKLNCWIESKNLKHFILLQNDLHDLIKQSLKILRRIYGKKSIINKINEKHELLGNEKYNIIYSMKQFMIDTFKNLLLTYFQEANKILHILPNSVHLKCTLTNIETETEQVPNIDYEEIKRLYYSFILIQSETLFIIANAYNGDVQYPSFRIPRTKLLNSIKHLTNSLAVYYSRLSKIMNSYQICEIQPIRRIFRGSSTLKWQDTYIHLDLTSQRIQLAYKEIVCILEAIDKYSEKNEDDSQLVETITEKMNEAYKQIENARSFAEFSSLLIAKAQHKSSKDFEKEKEDENLFSVDNDKKTVVIIDKDPDIEDEVFEEYIKEEYLKSLYENGDESIVQNFKLDKLLAKNFMCELKEALIEKQKSMTERELKALKRMYDKVMKNSSINKTEQEKFANEEKPFVSPVSQILLPPPVIENTIIAENNVEIDKTLISQTSFSLSPPPPPLPSLLPVPSSRSVITKENNAEEEEIELKKLRTPVPLPRVKMLQPEDEIPNVQRFSITECTPNFRFPPFKVTEETFLGSGENSEEEELERNSENEDEIQY